ncbi:MSMEG_4193 family putative phosphomutase [Nocardioides sp. HDW12B]|uniref:MSMEG_4193 family putative phosphomutase n=1 Tax=Nocardioides sp. HDW12B TaxID=2714939 RepID=UPI00140DD68B|nr:MSMEG_4193 family putative phosphomutase [Nocardioides sp. HDW12B]QIK66420.1 MSMEG_4193 family putative phosphomutase [Nocardioides sp. HDW12B]
MATVILVRHGRTTANTAGVLAGRSPGVRLDDRGREQVARLGERLSGVPLRGIVSSPMVRCRETAAAVAERQQPGPATVERESALAEVDYGEWTGGTLATLAKEPLWRTVQAHPSAVTFPGGESMSGMAARAVAAVRRWDARVAAEHGDDAPWVAVSHGDVIKAVLADALGIHLDQFQRIVVDPASVSVVRYTPDRPFVLMSNSHDGDLSFLAPPAKKRGAARKRRAPASGDAAVGGGAGPDRG